ncbi:MAG: hypothetical protein U0V72_05390 [Cytophagales bacterium]
MKRIILLLTSGLFVINSFAQRIRTIDTDSVTYFIDTQTNRSSWGGATWDGFKYFGTNTGAYSETNGYENTKKIVAALGQGTYAAYMCDTLILNNKQEWYLPSKNESIMIYNAFNSQGLFAQGWYWTSTDFNRSPYTSTVPFDGSAGKKWFGGGEGNIYEYSFKTDVYPSFCILKEKKVTTGINETKVVYEENESYKLYDLNGKETPMLPNTILIKHYSNGRVEKVKYID